MAVTSTFEMLSPFVPNKNLSFHRQSWILEYNFRVFLLLLMLPKILQSSSCGDAGSALKNPKDGACGEMDIRNSVKNFRMLENCTVIEGSLQISLIDYVPQEEYDKYSFPLLQEITGYLMMFRVFGLRTLRNLFPNLAVIRGKTKFFKEYALIAYEMRDLEELGLVGLTTINGSVRLTKNHKLCHINSIDWGELSRNVDPSKHLFADNREAQLCPDFCNESCPSTTYGNVKRKRCWTSNAKDCQKNLENLCKCSNGRPCGPNGSCCSENCIGGCTGPEDTDCYVCKNVVYQNRCLSECPPGTYMLYNRRCLTKTECLNLRSQSARSNRSESTESFPKILEGDGSNPNLCVFKCPSGYMVDDQKDQSIPECIRCQGFCPKVCNTTKVSSVQDSEKLLGCSKIEGNLEIQITGGKNIDYELTKNIGDIREVTGYIKIWKSYALLTLHFFRDLEIIGGEKSVHKGYSLFVADNTNLQEIFPEQQMKKMIIRKGGIGFHGNRKLCVSKIFSFIKQLNATTRLDEKRLDISNTSNGNLIPCDHNFTLKLSLFYEYQLLNVEWEKYPGSDNRQIINYIISYKEVTEPVKDIFEGKDACSSNEWITKDVKPDYTTDTIQQDILFGLKPFTKYAIYVQASTLPKASVSAVSRIKYFQTSPSFPSEPTDVEVSSLQPHELVIRWNPPKYPNGNVTHYKIFYHLQQTNTIDFEQRDFCKNSVTKEVQKEKEREKIDEGRKLQEMTLKTVQGNQTNCCDCPLSNEELQKKQRIQEIDIAVENALHDNTIVKMWGKECSNIDITSLHDGNATDHTALRPRQQQIVHNTSNDGLNISNPIIFYFKTISKDHETILNGNGTSSDSDDEGNTNSTTETFTPSPVHAVVYDTTVTLSNLEHYRFYNIEVMACHETDPVTGIKICGESAIIIGQTAADENSDNLNSSLITVEHVVNKSGEVLIRWEPPPLPNGVILKYYLMYKRVDFDRFSHPVVICVSTEQFHNNSNGYLLQSLQPGNYSLRICAHSLAGNGTYSPEMYFSVIPRNGGEEDNRFKLVIGLSLSVAVLIILLVTAVYCYHRHKSIISPDVIVSPNPIYIQTDQLYAPDEWEVSRDTIRLIKELGQGSFGTVFEGLLEDPETALTTSVAIKTVNDKADFHERLKILKEATTMKEIECHHIVKLLGVVSKGQPALVIMELMAHGDLRNYLRRCRPDEEAYPELYPPTTNQIRQMAGEIADGMVYLSDKKIVHGDLAARNCLVAEDGTVKIADFGMARDVYLTEYYRKDQKALLPVRWMAPESLKDGIFTTMSDIWSYGIVLWEMVTLAEQPYQGLGNDEVLHFVTEGRTMNSPLGCPGDLFSMMQGCWSYTPRYRPSFKNLLEQLVPYLNDRFQKVSYYHREINRKNDEHRREWEDGKNEEETENERDDKFRINQNFEEAGRNSDEQNDEHCDNLEDDIPYTTDIYQNPSISAQTNQRECFPLLLHQHRVQEPNLYPPSLSPGHMEVLDDYSSDDDEDIDSDNAFTKTEDKRYVSQSRDAKSASERLKLLSGSPDSPRCNKGALIVMPSRFPIKSGGESGNADEYTVMSPTAAASKVDEKHLLPSSLVSSQLVSDPGVLSHSQLIPSTAPPSHSSSPILHVNMERVGSSRGTNFKQPSDAVNLSGHGYNLSKPNQLIQSEMQRESDTMTNSRQNLNDSNSSACIIPGINEQSKDSNSSSGSSSFTPSTVNGHGPFSPHQPALC